MGLTKVQARKLLGHHPWVLAVDPLAQALPVLECLRLVDFSQEQVRGLVRQNPRLLLADTEGHLLPLVSYLTVSQEGGQELSLNSSAWGQGTRKGDAGVLSELTRWWLWA